MKQILKRTAIYLSLLIILTFLTIPIYALQDEFVKERGTNTTSLIFNTYFGARPVAMGGAFVALADDASCVFYNPAGLVSLNWGYFSTGFQHKIKDEMILASLSVVVPPKKAEDRSGWGLTAVGMYSWDGIQGYDSDGNPTKPLLTYGWMGMYTWATYVGDAFTKIGLNIKGYSQTFGDSYLYGGAVDIGYLDNLWIIQIAAVLEDIASFHYNSSGEISIADPFVKLGIAFIQEDNDFGISLDVGKNILTADLPDLNIGGFLKLYQGEEDIMETLEEEGDDFLMEDLDSDEVKFNDEIYLFVGFNKVSIFSVGLEFKFFGMKLDSAFMFPIEADPELSYYVNLDIHF